MSDKDMAYYRSLISVWMDEEHLTEQEESDLLHALRESEALRDYWFHLQSAQSILSGGGLMPNISKHYRQHDQLAYISTQLSARKKA